MTLLELYDSIGGDYEQASKVLRVERLIDKHIRRFASSEIVNDLLDAGRQMDPVRLFESAHALKGVCANLGLVDLADNATLITEEFRPGSSRKLSDEQVGKIIDRIGELYRHATGQIHRYAEG